MASVNQTRTHCVNQMGKTHSKPLAARRGSGRSCARHGNDMLCVNRPKRPSLQIIQILIKFLGVMHKYKTTFWVKDTRIAHIISRIYFKRKKGRESTKKKMDSETLVKIDNIIKWFIVWRIWKIKLCNEAYGVHY